MSVKRDSFLIIFISAMVFLTACSGGKPEQQKRADVVPVTAEKAVQKKVPVQISAIGTVEAYSTVGVKAQAGGEVTQVSFKEGEDVNKGDLLFTIDSRPYEAAIRQAEAILARDTVQIENARQDVLRYEDLAGKGYVARQQYDQVRTNAAALETTVNADKAVVENARLQLKYCSIFAPITGRTGSLMVNQGNLVKANADNPMVVINQIQPVYVSFSIPERYLQEIKRYGLLGRAKVEAGLSKDEAHPAEGLLTFMDNAIDSTTGTIRLKATFSNKEKRLWPGQFVNVTMTLATNPNAIVVTSQAVQTGQNCQYVFVVKSDRSAELRPVTVAQTLDDETVIEKGLKAGEEVVTDGQLRLIPGTKVAVKNNNKDAR